MANTTNFGWETPDDTDLVKDGALAIRTLGSAIDTSLVDLKGGTTGQVLSKNTNTDMDFVWVTQDDANAIQNSIVDAKGDLIAATADNTPARLASSGVNGEVLTIDTSTATGLKWAAPAGDITEVIAGTGMSGGGTSGSVTLTNTVATAYDAKGDLIVGTGADTFSKLTVGTNNHVLTADSTTATGLKWAAAAGGGKVLQVVSATYSTGTGIYTSTWTDSGLSLSITPSATSSKILVMASLVTEVYDANASTGGGIRLVRGATSILDLAGTDNTTLDLYPGTGGADNSLRALQTITYLDSPSTTSSTTYKVQGRTREASGEQIVFQPGSAVSSIILMEIGA